MQLSKLLGSERGAVMPIACTMLLALVALTSVAAKTAISAGAQSHRDRGVKRAAAVADGAVSIAMYRLNQLQPEANECVVADDSGNLSVGAPSFSDDGGTNNWCGEVKSASSGETLTEDGETYSYYVSPAQPGSAPHTEDRTIVATGKSRNVQRRVMTIVSRNEERWGPFIADVAKDLFIAGGASIDQYCKYCLADGAVRSRSGKIEMAGNARICTNTMFSETSSDQPAFIDNVDHFGVVPVPSQGNSVSPPRYGHFLWGTGAHWCYMGKAVSGSSYVGTAANSPDGGPPQLQRWERNTLAGTMAPANTPPANPDGNAALDGAFSHVGDASWNTPPNDYLSSAPSGVTWDPISKKLIVKNTTLILRGKSYDLCYLEVNVGGLISVQSTGPDGTTLYFRDPAECPGNPPAPGFQASNPPTPTADSVFFNGGGKIVNQTSSNPDPTKVKFEVAGSADPDKHDDAVWFDSNFSPAPGFQAIQVNAPRSMVALHGTSNINGVKAEYLDIDQNSGITWDSRISNTLQDRSAFARKRWYECTALPTGPSLTSGCKPAS